MDSVLTGPPAAQPTRVPWSQLAWALVAIAFVAYGILLARHVEAYAGGSDSSGYLNHARLLAAGHLHLPVRAVPELEPQHLPVWTYTALGFRPAADGNGLVPTYPSGLPLLLAATASIVGWAHAGVFLLWLHGMAGVVLTYAAARVFRLSMAWALAAAVIVAASPLYLFFSVTLMSDVPATVWATGSVLLAWRSRTHRWPALGAGAVFAMGVLIRPTNVLMIVPLGILLGLSARRWLLFVCGGVPGAAFFFAHTHAAYGAFFTSGYGDAAQLQSLWIKRTLSHCGQWLPILFTPLVVAFVGLPCLWKRDRRTVLTLGAWVLGFVAFYAAYEFTHQAWWFLRFLLPTAPALVIGSLLVLRTMAGERRPVWAIRAAVAVAAIGAAAFEYHWTDKLAALDAGKGERVYARTTDWLNDHLPRDAVLAVMQGSGAVVYGTNFEFIRWDWFQADTFPPVAQRLHNTQRPLYAVLFPFEIDELHAFTEHLSHGHWTKIGQVEQVTIWKWEPPPPPP